MCRGLAGRWPTSTLVCACASSERHVRRPWQETGKARCGAGGVAQRDEGYDEGRGCRTRHTCAIVHRSFPPNHGIASTVICHSPRSGIASGRTRVLGGPIANWRGRRCRQEVWIWEKREVEDGRCSDNFPCGVSESRPLAQVWLAWRLDLQLASVAANLIRLKGWRHVIYNSKVRDSQSKENDKCGSVYSSG